MLSWSRSSGGFTIVELMIVITIIVILMSVSLFPYGEYMKRASLNTSFSILGQEWILAHKEIRNGSLFSEGTGSESPKHAYRLFVFEKGATSIPEYLLSGAQIPLNLSSSSDARFLKNISLEKGIEIQSLASGSTLSKLYYRIAPFGIGSEGGVFLESPEKEFDAKEIILTIGYPGGTIHNGRAKEILLHPYLQ